MQMKRYTFIDNGISNETVMTAARMAYQRQQYFSNASQKNGSGDHSIAQPVFLVVTVVHPYRKDGVGADLGFPLKVQLAFTNDTSQAKSMQNN